MRGRKKRQKVEQLVLEPAHTWNIGVSGGNLTFYDIRHTQKMFCMNLTLAVYTQTLITDMTDVE